MVGFLHKTEATVSELAIKKVFRQQQQFKMSLIVWWWMTEEFAKNHCACDSKPSELCCLPT